MDLRLTESSARNDRFVESKRPDLASLFRRHRVFVTSKWVATFLAAVCVAILAGRLLKVTFFVDLPLLSIAGALLVFAWLRVVASEASLLTWAAYSDELEKLMKSAPDGRR